MSLDATAREANVLDSIKKFFIDTLKTYQFIPVIFDTGLNNPNIRDSSVEKWVSVNIGDISPDKVSSIRIRLYLCSRNDKEGFKLAQLRDTVMGYLTDSSQNDGVRRFPLYKSHIDVNKWTIVGNFYVTVEITSGNLPLDDLTKYKIIECTLRWGSKI